MLQNLIKKGLNGTGEISVSGYLKKAPVRLGGKIVSLIRRMPLSVVNCSDIGIIVVRSVIITIIAIIGSLCVISATPVTTSIVISVSTTIVLVVISTSSVIFTSILIIMVSTSIKILSILSTKLHNMLLLLF